ncbi:hypothetical protein [Azospirillum sp. sgz302134]
MNTVASFVFMVMLFMGHRELLTDRPPLRARSRVVPASQVRAVGQLMSINQLRKNFMRMRHVADARFSEAVTALSGVIMQYYATTIS